MRKDGEEAVGNAEDARAILRRRHWRKIPKQTRTKAANFLERQARDFHRTWNYFRVERLARLAWFVALAGAHDANDAARKAAARLRIGRP
jgi:hypothetical protein